MSAKSFFPVVQHAWFHTSKKYLSIGLVEGCVFSTAISIICNYIWSQSRKILTPTKIISDPPQMIPDTFWVGPYLPLIIDSESNKLAIESRMKFDWLTWLFQINSTWTIFLFHLSITTWKWRVLATPPPTFIIAL